jgi:hypothetical protein
MFGSVTTTPALTIVGWDALLAQGALKLVRLAVRGVAGLVRAVRTVLTHVKIYGRVI